MKLWYPFLIRTRFDKSKPICFVVSSYNLPLDYFKYLRKKYPGCKIVKIYRDLVSVIGSNHPEYKPENVKSYFDLLMCYDYNEAKELGIEYFDEIESIIDVPKSEKYPLSDVFIAAKAKDRLGKILRAYDVFTNYGLKCDFYLTGVPEDQRVYKQGITYAEKYMPYKEMLFKSINSRCMFDINQGGAVGYTSRFLEAVMYNKRIITDNSFICGSKYYDPRYIQIIETVDDIDPSFVTKDYEIVDYKYDNDFSPVHLIGKIEKLLTENNKTI